MRRRRKLRGEVQNAAPATLLPPAGAGREPGGAEAQQEDSEGSTGRAGEARGEASEEAKRAAEDLLNIPQMNKMATKTGEIPMTWAE